MRKPFFIFPLMILTVSAVAFTACGEPDTSQNSSTVPESVYEQPSTPTPTPTPAPSTGPSTEEELRDAIAKLGAAEDTTPQRQDYYEKLYAMDLFGEEDYLALAQIYANQGNWEQQRSMLSKVLRLYPSREYAQMLSDIVIRGDSSDQTLAALAGQIIPALEQQDAQALLGLIQNTQWRQVFPETLDGIETKVHYTDNGGVLQIFTDGLTAELTWHTASGGFFLCRNDSAGTLLLSAFLENNAYNGPFSASCLDPSGAELKFVQGTLSGGVCIDRLTIRYQGTEYQGTFDNAGKTEEEQLKEVLQKGGVLYAYDTKQKTYLYQQDTTVEEFRIDTAFLGLPEYTEWQ